VLEADGERVIPDLQREQLVYAEHVARYRFAAQLAKGKRVLDAACGEGYGAAMLRDAGAASVVGIDNVRSVVEHARARYGIEAVEGDVRELPFDDASFDLVVSFETIEHVPDPERAIAEFRRVLVQDGRLAISTPNRDEYLVENEFHELELTPDEFLELLSSEFSEQLRLYQQNWLVSAVVDEGSLRSEDPDQSLEVRLGKVVGSRPGEELFSVVVCGPDPGPLELGAVATGIYEAYRMADEANTIRAAFGQLEHDAGAWRERAQAAEQDSLASREELATVANERDALRERAEEADRSLAAMSHVADDLEERALRLELELSASAGLITDLETDLAATSRLAEDASATVRRMEESKSWRLTAPLRWGAARLRRRDRSSPTASG